MTGSFPADSTLRELSEYLLLVSIYAIELGGVRRSSEDAARQETSLSTKYHSGDQRLDFLFEAVVKALAETGDEVATFTVSTVATFSTNLDTRDVPRNLLEDYGNEIALYAAYPYIRESVQDLSRRLGLPSLTIPLLKRGTPPPFTQPE